MSSIYNTSRNDKGKARVPVRGRGRGVLRTGIGTQRTPPQRQQQPQPNQEETFNEFQLLSTARKGQHHLMDFKSNNNIDPTTFSRPVKLHRKETNFLPFRQYMQNINEQKSAEEAAKKEAAAKAAAIMAGTAFPEPSAEKKTPSQVEDLGGESSTIKAQHGPKTGADTSLIAPLGGATRNKQMLFKKRTKQIYLAKEDTRELKEQEHRPWILEDYDGHNSFTGTLEGGQRSEYMFFVLTNNGFRVMPVDRWYKFQAKRNVTQLTIEEAEEQLKKQQKKTTERWMMKRGEEHEEGGNEHAPKSRLKTVDSGENKGGSDDEGNRQDSDMDDLDFDDVFQDDEEGAGEHEVEDEEIKDGKDRVKKEINTFSIGNQIDDDFESFDDGAKLTTEGKQLKKLMRNHEKNRVYESDEDKNPYASSTEELDTDNDDDEEDKTESEKEKEKKTPMPPKKKASAASKPMMPKKAHSAKTKKEGLSRPIGRPGSPALHGNSSQREGSPVGRPSSPLGNKSPSPARHTSSSPSPRTTSPGPSGNKEHIRKRKMEDTSVVKGLDVKHRKINTGASIPSPSTGVSDEDVITEREVIETLRGKTLTTKEFLMSFRKRIKKNPKNRDVITMLLKKVAKRNASADPNTRMLELRTEFQ